MLPFTTLKQQYIYLVMEATAHETPYAVQNTCTRYSTVYIVPACALYVVILPKVQSTLKDGQKS
jgi:hypothetical protein